MVQSIFQWCFDMSHHFSFEADIWGPMNHCSCTVEVWSCPEVYEQPEEPSGAPQTAAQTSLGISLPSVWHGHHARGRRTEKYHTCREFSQELGLTYLGACAGPRPCFDSPRACQFLPPQHSAVWVQSTINPTQTDAKKFLFFPVNNC